MPNFEFAPWIKPPDSIAKSFAQGLGIAADVQNQRAQLQQRQDEEAQRTQLERQRLAQEQQYRQQQYGISQQELMQSQQLNQLKIQDAQRRFAAQQQYQQDLASGVDPLKAIMKNFPGTDESMTGYGQLARQMQLQKQMSAPAKPITFKDPVSGKDVSYLQSYTAEGAPHYQRMIEPPDTMTKSMMLQQSNYLREQLRQLRAAQIKATSDPLYQMSLTKPESELNATAKESIQEVKDRQQEISDLEAQLNGIYSETGAPPLKTTTPSPTKPGAGFKVISIETLPEGGGNVPIAPPIEISPDAFPPLR
jgi:hypothetical protein